MVNKENLVEVATAIHDEFGYDLLAALTAVDYIAENKMEVVYHLHKTTGGAKLVFKTQAERVDPIEIPSVTGIWAGAEYQEREAYDLYGIKFTGHPDLRRGSRPLGLHTWHHSLGKPTAFLSLNAFSRHSPLSCNA
jgi:NADH:ubiquinone oxidoreductase subunit C